jgi:hypothetical protein
MNTPDGQKQSIIRMRDEWVSKSKSLSFSRRVDDAAGSIEGIA